MSEKMGKKPSSQILKVNKYEDAQMALKLISHICTTSQSLNISSIFYKYDELINHLLTDIEDCSLANNSFISDLYEWKDTMEYELLESITSSVSIVVAGGFSAGKSSLLNKLTKLDELLPTGVEPVSVVNTCINCNSNIRNLTVKGENLKNDLVLLNEEVLECIQHSSKSKTYIAPILNRIIIDTPAEQYLDGITFVDTPGYNNSISISDSDRDKAIKALKGGNAILWCVDIECGTITKNDLDILKQFKEDKPIVILFTKMDKKSDSEVRKIVEDTAKICQREFGKDHMPLDIMAISCLKGWTYSINNRSFKDIIKQIKSESSVGDLLEFYKYIISDLFENEINASKGEIDRLEGLRLENVSRKGEINKVIQNDKKYYANLKDAIYEVLVDSYTGVYNCACERYDCFVDVYNYWCEALSREGDWLEKSGIFSNTDDLVKKWHKAIEKSNSHKYDLEKNKRLFLNYDSEEDRIKLYEKISEEIDSILSKYEDIKDGANDEYSSIVERKKSEEKLINIMQQYKVKFLNALNDAYSKSVKDINAYNRSLQKIETEETDDVFSAISGDNFDRFLSCFSDGVDLSICNKEGYSPITWAVHLGNNEMVKFFIKHDVDLSAKDNRGYNALETAAICHYKDLCELLIEADRSLIGESQSLEKLASKNNNFIEWVSKFN